MANYRVGQKIKCKFEDAKKLFAGTVVKVEADHIIVDVPELSDHCWFDEDMYDLIIS